MAQVIYTGENYSRYVPSQGRALNALSQVVQQDAYRKEREKERQREDRNMLAEAFKMDPVYATSIELQGEMSNTMDQYMKDAAILEKQIRDQPHLTTEHLMKAQQLKAQTAAKVGQYSAWDKELQRAAQLVKQRPDVYDARKFAEAYKELRDDKVMPKEGLLFPAVKNPIDEFGAYASKRRGTPKEEREWVPNKDGTGSYAYYPVYPNEEKVSESDLIKMYGGSEMGQYYIQNSFDDPSQVSVGERQQYLKDAGGDEVTAANMWFQDGVRGTVYPKYKRMVESKPSVASTRVDTSGIHAKGQTVYSGNNALFSVQKNIPVSDGKMKDAVLFARPQAYKNPSSLPQDILLLPDGVEVKASTVQALPYAADKTKTYWIIDKEALDKITVTESGMKALNAVGTDFEKIGDKPPYKYKFKEDYDSDVMIPTRTGDVVGLLNGWTGGRAGDYIAALPGTSELIPYPTKEAPKEPASGKDWSQYKRK